MNNQERIAELKKELASYTNKSKKTSQEAQERQEIARLQREVRAKKYAKLKQTGRNLKIISKNIGVGFKAVGKGFEKAIGEDPNKAKSPQKIKTVDEILRDLPQ